MRRELDELGLDSAGDAVLLVEWPERAGERHWPDALRLSSTSPKMAPAS